MDFRNNRPFPISELVKFVLLDKNNFCKYQNILWVWTQALLITELLLL